MDPRYFVVCSDSGPTFFNASSPPVEGAVLRTLSGRGGGVPSYTAWTLDAEHPLVPGPIRGASVEEFASDVYEVEWSLVFTSTYEQRVPTLMFHDGDNALGHALTRSCVPYMGRKLMNHPEQQSTTTSCAVSYP